MTLLVTAQVLFVIGLVLFAFGLIGCMIENSVDEVRYLAPLLAGIAIAILSGIVWIGVDTRSPCREVPARAEKAQS